MGRTKTRTPDQVAQQRRNATSKYQKTKSGKAAIKQTRDRKREVK